MKLWLLWNYEFFSHLLALVLIAGNVRQKIAVGASTSNQTNLAVFDQHLGRTGVAQEPQRASGSSVGTRLKYPNQVANLCSREINLSSKNIQWRT